MTHHRIGPVKAPLALPLADKSGVWVSGGQREQISTTMRTLEPCLLRGNVS